jgi:hypothetical protein
VLQRNYLVFDTAIEPSYGLPNGGADTSMMIKNLKYCAPSVLLIMASSPEKMTGTDLIKL